MNSTLRNVLAVLAGLVVGSVVNMGLVTVGPMVIAPPPGFDVTSTESLQASAHLLEPRHFVFPFLAHALGTLVGALVAYLFARGRRTAMALIVGAIFLGGGVAAATMIPAPVWFIALDLVVAYVPMAWLGSVIGSRLSSSPSAADDAP
ncbi:MAG: hypothetical protein AAF552_16615 [Pseudomonadota bacterium]